MCDVEAFYIRDRMCVGVGCLPNSRLWGLGEIWKQQCLATEKCFRARLCGHRPEIEAAGGGGCLS